jgi:hypothetical protein
MLYKVLLFAALVPVCMFAQRTHGYGFFAPSAVTGGGDSDGAMNIGVGGEARILRNVGLGAEVSWFTPWQSFDSGFGIFSPNGYIHFVNDRRARFDPYATIGYSLFFRSGTASLLNFGGGANWWFSDRLGLKFEVRDHVRPDSRLTVHFWGVRAGVTIR